MKIGLNAFFYSSSAHGSSQYLYQLIHALAEIDKQNEYLLLGPQPLPQERSESLASNITYLHASAPSLVRRNENIEKVVWEQFTGPVTAHKAGVDVFHVPYFAPPLFPRTSTVVTIHDVIPLRLPLYRAGAKVEAYTRLVSRAAHKATLVITISQHAKQDMIDALKLPPERIRVIYQAAGDEYHPVTDEEKLAQAQQRYGVGGRGGRGGRYVFYLGGLDQRKNVLQLVRAFAALYHQLNEPDLKLLIAGNPDKQQGPLFPDPRPVATELGITDQIIYRYIEEQDKPALYSGASIFVFPSIYEGFGLTPLEAMQCGAPVICSNRTSLPEVVGDAAITLDPDNTQVMVEAMHNVLTDETLAADLRARSLQQATQFSWRRAARETLAVYEEVVARSKQ